MAFLSIQHHNIQLRVNDLVRGDTKVGQVAVVVGQNWDQFPTGSHRPDGAVSDGSMSVNICLWLQLYALNGPDLGAPLADDPRFVTLAPTLNGRNDTLVDAATGEILGVRQQYPDAADWGAFCRSFTGRDTILQGDYFEGKRGQNVITDNEIMHHLQEALRLGRFA